MNLQEFRRTKVVMTLEQAINLGYIENDCLNTDTNIINKETARVHTYCNGLYIRELINGLYVTDMVTNCKNKQELDIVEFCFWEEFAERVCNPKLKLPNDLTKALLDFKRATAQLTEEWLKADEDSYNELLGHNMPLEDSFDEFNSNVKDWIDNLTK